MTCDDCEKYAFCADALARQAAGPIEWVVPRARRFQFIRTCHRDGLVHVSLVVGRTTALAYPVGSLACARCARVVQLDADHRAHAVWAVPDCISDDEDECVLTASTASCCFGGLLCPECTHGVLQAAGTSELIMRPASRGLCPAWMKMMNAPVSRCPTSSAQSTGRPAEQLGLMGVDAGDVVRELGARLHRGDVLTAGGALRVLPAGTPYEGHCIVCHCGVTATASAQIGCCDAGYHVRCLRDVLSFAMRAPDAGACVMCRHRNSMALSAEDTTLLTLCLGALS